MASPLLLALSASAALIAGPALACEGQECWGMAPAQQLNPGYTGPDYSQFAGPQDGYGPGPQDGYGPGPQDGYDAGGPGPDGYNAANDPRPYLGPIEGLAAQQQARAWRSADASAARHGYGYGQQSFGGAPPYGRGPQAEGYGPPQGDEGGPDYDDYQGSQGDGSPDVYGPPRDYSPSAQGYGPPEGEPPSAYAPRRQAPAYGYDRYSYNAPYGHPAMDGGPGAPGGPITEGPGQPQPPYQAYRSDGYEHYAHTPQSSSGYRSSSYRAGSVSEYDYDSGWVEDTGRSAYAPGGYPTADDAYGPPCIQCGSR